MTDEEVVQIAREAVATDWERDGGSPERAAQYRDGTLDTTDSVRIAILGARAVAAKLSGGASERYAPMEFEACDRCEATGSDRNMRCMKCGGSGHIAMPRKRIATPPAEPAVVLALQIERLIAAIEGELDGLDCHPDKARNILHYVMTGLLPDEVVPVPPEHPDSKVWRRSDGHHAPFPGGRTRAEWERIGNASMQVETEEND